MKKAASVMVLLFGMSQALFAESYRPTTDDMYGRSYGEAMREHMAKIYAAQDRAVRQICDEHHNCVPATEQKEDKTGLFFCGPVWY